MPDVTISVPASGEKMFALPASHLSSAGLASMTYDNEADLTLAVLNVEQ